MKERAAFERQRAYGLTMIELAAHQGKRPIKESLQGCPGQQALWIKYDRIGNQLQEIARKADLVAWALQGVMALEENNAVWPIQDAAYEIQDALKAIADEVRL